MDGLTARLKWGNTRHSTLLTELLAVLVGDLLALLRREELLRLTRLDKVLRLVEKLRVSYRARCRPAAARCVISPHKQRHTAEAREG